MLFRSEAAQLDVATVSPGPVSVGRPIDELLRDTERARLSFDGARRAFEKKKDSLDEETKKAEDARVRAEKAEKQWAARGAELDLRERSLNQREDALAARERDADTGFLARRKEMLKPLEDERVALQSELVRLRADSTEEQIGRAHV